MDRGSFARRVETQELDHPVRLVVDLIMFKGEGEASSNLAVWRGDEPQPQQLQALRDYLNQQGGLINVSPKANEFV